MIFLWSPFIYLLARDAERTGGMAPPEILNPGTVAENYSGGRLLTVAS